MASVVQKYCLCGLGYDACRFMIQCDVCKEWFHGSCVQVKEHESVDIDKFHCMKCQTLCGPTVLKERRNWHRQDYSDPDADAKAVQAGTPVFVRELKTRHFPSADDVTAQLRGQQLTLPYFVQHNFDRPIVIDSKDGLGIMMPPDSFTVNDVMDYIGEDFLLDVIDVCRQEDIKMTMKEWVSYFNNPIRTKIYNVISLEFSNTSLAEIVKPPGIVQKVSWVENYWPPNLPPELGSRPQVMKYCLMGTEDSYTDFHIDFGGTSVWYHVIRGEKVFYLIKPTQTNLSLYETWMSAANQSETFFGDQAESCHKLVLSKGQTLFIPTGWIHAVLTTKDSLVFGGNFLCSLNIPLQIQVHDIEERIKTPHKYRFPSFEVTNWVAAPHVGRQLKDFSESNRRPPNYLVTGSKVLVAALKSWTQDKEKMRDSVMLDYVLTQKVIKDLAREVRMAEKMLTGKREGKRIRTAPLHKAKKAMALLSERAPFGFTPNRSPSKKNVKLEGELKPPDTPDPSDKGNLLKLRVLHGKVVSDQSDGELQKSDSVYDFVDSDDDALVVDENPKAPKNNSGFRQRVPARTGKQTPLKLKLSINGKQTLAKDENVKDEEEPTTPKNGTIDDLLLASGYNVDQDSTRVSLDDDLSGGRTSPSTREAIQGMLSMSKSVFTFSNSETDAQNAGVDKKTSNLEAFTDSRLLGLSLLATGSVVARKSRPVPRGGNLIARKRDKFYEEDDFEQSLKNCHQDDEFIYLGLDTSDDEIHVFKPRGRNKHDESWNPKARVNISCPKPERPVREGVKKEAIESGLAAAAAKLAHLPPPKRPYNKKKATQSNSSKLKDVEPQPGTSAGLKRPSSSADAALKNFSLGKKPRKGFATTKQRLGKILKMHKMLY